MSRSISITVVLAIGMAAPARAAMIPLLEMKWQQVDFELGPVPATVEFRFIATAGNEINYLRWIAEHGPSDVGNSFWAPADVVDGANAALKSSDARYTFMNGIGNYMADVPIPIDQAPTSEPPCPTAGDRCFGVAIYVDDIERHTVTSVERVLNYLDLTGPTGNFVVTASQSIRYWGTIVPEPSAVMLLSFGMLHLCLSSRPRRLS